MKIGGPNGPSAAGALGRSRPGPGGEGFAPSAAEEAGSTDEARRLESLEGVITMSALLALQGVDDPLQRRRRMVGRAGRILDLLDELKLALIDGEASTDTLDRLVIAVREERATTEDPRLDAVLDQIETRAAVELAKLGRSRAA
ncbi:MAG TPA: flagellar assembly protein FliX [Caulobacteraceae bacterium]|nr:flagellar assembly protein FliX [Caulobacteraceae bacterium]